MSKIYRSNRKDYSVSGKVTSLNGNPHIKRGVLKGKGLKEGKEKSSSDNKGNIFGLILFVLIFISLCAFLKGDTFSTLTFKGFLEFLSNAPSFDITWSLFDINLGDWGAFNFLRDFINIFANIVEVLVMLFGMIWESLEFLLYLVKGLLFS